MFCIKCGADMKGSKSFCYKCGHKISADSSAAETPAPDPMPQAKGIFCIKCGESLPENIKFCHKCGSNVPRAADSQETPAPLPEIKHMPAPAPPAPMPTADKKTHPPSKMPVVLCILFGLIAIGGIGFGILQMRNNEPVSTAESTAPATVEPPYAPAEPGTANQDVTNWVTIGASGHGMYMRIPPTWFRDEDTTRYISLFGDGADGAFLNMSAHWRLSEEDYAHIMAGALSSQEFLFNDGGVGLRVEEPHGIRWINGQTYAFFWHGGNESNMEDFVNNESVITAIAASITITAAPAQSAQN